MKGTLRIAALIAVVCAAGEYAPGQPAPKKTPSLAQLELTAEVAATTDDGYPAALRITLKNVGNVVVDMPVLGPACMPESGVKVRVAWTPRDPSPLGQGWGGSGGSCFHSLEPLVQQIEEHWVHLRPGEFMTTSVSLRDHTRDLGPGTIEYCVEYIPPEATPAVVEELLKEGHIIPTEKLATEHQTFSVR